MQLNREIRVTALAICCSWMVSACNSTTGPAPAPAAPAQAAAAEASQEPGADPGEAEQRRALEAHLLRCRQQPEVCVQSTAAAH